mgnify:CR=1 FL=1
MYIFFLTVFGAMFSCKVAEQTKLKQYQMIESLSDYIFIIRVGTANQNFSYNMINHALMLAGLGKLKQYDWKNLNDGNDEIIAKFHSLTKEQVSMIWQKIHSLPGVLLFEIGKINVNEK